MAVEQEAKTLIENLTLAVPTLIGIAIGAALSWIPLWLQLRHDSKEKEKERIMSLRRDVYLNAAENIGQLMDYLVGFYNINIAVPEGFTSSIQKIDIIGSNETIIAMNNLNDHMSESFSKLVPKREEIIVLEERGKTFLGLLEHSDDIKKEFQAYEKLFDKQVELTYNLAGECQRKTQIAEELIVPIVVAIRKEMGTTFDETAYRSMMVSSHEKWKKNTEEFVSSMKSTYEDVIQPLFAKLNHLIEDNTDNDLG